MRKIKYITLILNLLVINLFAQVGNEWIVPIGGGGSVTYDILVNSVDTGQDLDMDGTNHDININ